MKTSGGWSADTTRSRLTNYILVDEMSHLGEDLPLLPSQSRALWFRGCLCHIQCQCQLRIYRSGKWVKDQARPHWTGPCTHFILLTSLGSKTLMRLLWVHSLISWKPLGSLKKVREEPKEWNPDDFILYFARVYTFHFLISHLFSYLNIVVMKMMSFHLSEGSLLWGSDSQYQHQSLRAI